MPAIAEKRRVSPRILARLDQNTMCELIDGRLVEKDMGAKACVVAGLLCGMLSTFIRKRNLGFLLIEGTYTCFPGRNSDIRRPDISFIRRERVSGGIMPDGNIPFPPDLIIEVASAHDKFSEVNKKLKVYFEAGVQEIWVIDPLEKLVFVHGSAESNCTYSVTGTLKSEKLLPGFSCKLRELFASV